MLIYGKSWRVIILQRVESLVLRKNNVSRCSFERVRRNPCAKSMRSLPKIKLTLNESCRSSIKQTLASAVTNALSCSTSPGAVRPNPLTTAPVPFRKKARSSRAAFLMPNDRRAFRQRFGDGRFAAAPFPPSLRLRFTFPFAEPLAETFTCLSNFLSLDLPLGKLPACRGYLFPFRQPFKVASCLNKMKRSSSKFGASSSTQINGQS